MCSGMREHERTMVAFMRHARTEWNEAGRIQGWLDSSLSCTGRSQAAQWGNALVRFDFDRVVCSDLGRAMETACPLSESSGLVIEKDARFRERDYGYLAGTIPAQGVAFSPVDRPGGGETLQEVCNRAMEGLCSLAGGGRVLVVTHAGVLASLLPYLAGPAHPLRDGRLLKSRRLHWVGVATCVGIVELNGRMLP